jgi:ring-1,2-phenylacetyl-CoA epoxidase subunit PaaE
MLQYTLKVAEIRQETKDTVTIIFKQPSLKKVKYLAGQYITLIFRINNRKYVRPYSFSSAPGIDTTLNITVKRVPGGVVSNHIADCLKVGDVVEVMEPMGDFTLENKGIESNNHIVLWGAGSGITPLLSLGKFALHKKIAEHVTLVYGNRNNESAIFSQQIRVLKQDYAATFSAWHFYTQIITEESDSYVIQGRIDAQKVIEVLKQERDLAHSFHYICGPVGLKESITTLLKSYGVPLKNIFSEEFDLLLQPQIFDDIKTRTVRISKAENIYEVEVVKGKTILEACLDAMLDLSYSCQTGNCLLCKAKLVSGEVKLITSEVDKQNLDENERLLCCSLPLTEDIEFLISG